MRWLAVIRRRHACAIVSNCARSLGFFALSAIRMQASALRSNSDMSVMETPPIGQNAVGDGLVPVHREKNRASRPVQLRQELKASVGLPLLGNLPSAIRTVPSARTE